MLINLRNALMTGKRLPYDAEVEYLQSTGTQWIDTGVAKTATTTVDCVFSLSATTTSAIFGGRVSAYGNRLALFCLGTYFRIDADTQVTLSISPDTTSVFRIQYDGVTATLTNLTTGTSDSKQVDIGAVTSNKIYAFGVNTSGQAGSLSKCRIYAFKIKQNGVLVRDYIPVRKGTVGYLYDRVSGELFGNAGTGDFVVGQDVVLMTWQDGLQYNNVGTSVESANSSIGLDYIPITAGHSFTWRLGYGSSASADLIIYNANKERIDYWVARDRTVTISGAAAYMRISALTSYKEQATVYDETAQKYVFANGRIPAE